MKLQGTRLIRRTAVASLNYECVFEVGARRLGLSLCINLDASGPSQMLMFEPHRSCNLLPDFEAYGFTMQLESAGGSYMDGEVTVKDLPEVRAMYDSEYAYPA